VFSYRGRELVRITPGGDITLDAHGGYDVSAPPAVPARLRPPLR
jgi:hypothetical protein